MRRMIAVALVLALVFSLAGCASKEEREAAKAVSAQIENLVDVTLEDAAAVVEAQEAYEALTDKARELVKNYDILETARVDLAQIVTDMIDGIGTVTLDSEAAIEAAKTAYSNLPEESRALVENFPVLQDAFAEWFEIFSVEMNKLTDIILEINEALNNCDVATVLSLIEENLPMARKVAGSKYYLVDGDPIGTLEDIQELMGDACYPNTQIITLDNYIKIKDVRNATADSNEDEVPNADSDTGREFYGYIYNSKNEMNNAFRAYTEYLGSHFELVRKKNTPAKTEYSPVIETMFTTAAGEYFYRDEQGHTFSIEWDYLDMGSYYGDLSTIYVYFAPEMGVRDAAKAN